MRKNRGVVAPPTRRTPKEPPPLTPEERLHEHLEARRQTKSWDAERSKKRSYSLGHSTENVCACASSTVNGGAHRWISPSVTR